MATPHAGTKRRTWGHRPSSSRPRSIGDLLPASRGSSGHPAIFSIAPRPQYRGTIRGAQSAAPHHPSILLKKARWGRMGGSGGRRAPCAPAKGPSFPRNQPRPPPCPHLRKRQRIFILMCWPGDRMAYGHVPRPGAENARHGARARVPPRSDQGATQTGERCPHACPGPFFTISPLQPSSRGYYELYQGRCLEISCGAPPR